MKNLIRLLISALVLILLFVFFVDGREVWVSMQRVRPEYLLMALGVVALDRFAMTYKWLILLDSVHPNLHLLHGMMIYCTATLMGTVLPVTVGGDVIRGVLATRAGISGDHVVASIIVERVLGFLCVMMLGVASLGILRSLHLLGPKYDSALILAMAVFCGGALLAAASFDERSIKLLELLPNPLRRASLTHRFERLLRAYHQLGANGSVLGSFSALTILEQFMPGLVTWLLLKGMGVEVNIVLLYCALLLSLIVARLPISIDGLGLFEGVFAALMKLAGVKPEYSIATALLARVLQLVACFPWWLAYTRLSGRFRGGPVRGAVDADTRKSPRT